jgi:hypothetical protein
MSERTLWYNGREPVVVSEIRQFVKSLTDINFVINPYDPCVANKMIDGKQMPILFHVNNCKLSPIASERSLIV